MKTEYSIVLPNGTRIAGGFVSSREAGLWAFSQSSIIGSLFRVEPRDMTHYAFRTKWSVTRAQREPQMRALEMADRNL